MVSNQNSIIVSKHSKDSESRAKPLTPPNIRTARSPAQAFGLITMKRHKQQLAIIVLVCWVALSLAEGAVAGEQQQQEQQPAQVGVLSICLLLADIFNCA